MYQQKQNQIINKSFDTDLQAQKFQKRQKPNVQSLNEIFLEKKQKNNYELKEDLLPSEK